MESSTEIYIPLEISNRVNTLRDADWEIKKFLKKLTPEKYFWKMNHYEYNKFMDDPLIFYTDGSCLGNAKGRKLSKKPGGIGVFVGDYDPRNISAAFEAPLPITNIRAELFAMYKALVMIQEHVDDLKEHKSRGFLIITDSEFTFHTLMFHYNTVKNLDLVKMLIRRAEKLICADIPFKIEYCRGHKKKPTDKNSREYRIWYGNDQADYLAKGGSLQSKYYKEK